MYNAHTCAYNINTQYYEYYLRWKCIEFDILFTNLIMLICMCVLINELCLCAC